MDDPEVHLVGFHERESAFADKQSEIEFVVEFKMACICGFVFIRRLRRFMQVVYYSFVLEFSIAKIDQ